MDDEAHERERSPHPDRGGATSGADSLVLHRAAEAVAARWAGDVAEVRLLAVSENAVYRVDTVGGDRFVLRLHRPGYNTIDEMESEQAWVESLHAAGVAVPRPRRSLAGGRYETVPLGPGPDADHRWVGAIEWVDGTILADLVDDEPVERQAEIVPDLYRAVGALAARIRRHAAEWQPPAGFARRAWDADGLLGPEPLWGRFWDVAVLSDAQATLLEHARDRLYERLQSLPTDASSYGLIHADLHQSNVMFGPEGASAIDFDDAGFGWFIHELGVALQAVIDEPWADVARGALIDGYRTVHPLDDDELAHLDAFCTVRSLMLIGWLDARPELEAHAQLPSYVTFACAEAEKYLETVR